MKPVEVTEPEIDWTSIDTQIRHEGREIVLPGDPDDMDYDAAISTLQRVKEAENQKFNVAELIAGAPWDALVALYSAMQAIYGVVLAETKHTPMGDIKPELMTVRIGYLEHEQIQVPVGQMRLPNFVDPVGVALTQHGAVVGGEVRRRDRARLIDIANLARRLLRERSIYKGKAVRIHVDDRGRLVLTKQPEFIDLRNVSEADAIHTAETTAMIRTNIYAPLKNTEACRRHKVPLKRGILLESRYGMGKTLTARCTAKVAVDHNWTFLMLDRAQGLREAIEFGKNYQPCVIFAEDIDRAADRTEESVNDLVNLLDGLISKDSEMMVVLTTNFIERIDQSLLRPGRFDAIVSIQAPDAETAGRLIRHYAGGLLSPAEDITQACNVIAGQIPAIIREVVERAKLAMMTEGRDNLTSDDLCVSAIGLKRHIDLLAPPKVAKTPRDMLFEGLGAAVAEAVGMGNEAMSELHGKVDAVHEELDDRFQSLDRGIDFLKLPVIAAALGSKAVFDNTKTILATLDQKSVPYPDLVKGGTELGKILGQRDQRKGRGAKAPRPNCVDDVDNFYWGIKMTKFVSVQRQKRTPAMSLHEHRTGRRGKETTPARAAAERLFKKPVPNTEPSAPTPATTPPPRVNSFDDKVCLTVLDGAVFQLNSLIPKKLWEDIGRPPRVDITGLPSEGFQIRPGQKYKVQNTDMKTASKKALRVQATCKALGLPSQKQQRAIVFAKVRDGYLQLDAVPPEWMGYNAAAEARAKIEEAAAPLDTGNVVNDVAQPPDKLAAEESNNDIGQVVLRSNSAGMMLSFTVPAHLLVKIGEPKRVVIIGTPYEGWTVRESHDGGIGVTVNYKTGSNVYLSRGLSDQKMPDKRGRKKFSIRMTAEGDHLKISGPNFEWIRGANIWLTEPPAPPLATVTNGHMGHHETNGNGGHSGVSPLAKNGQATSLPQVGDVPTLQAELAQQLATARETKTKLEQITGMKLVFTKDGNVTVSFMVPGTIAPKDQKTAPPIT